MNKILTRKLSLKNGMVSYVYHFDDGTYYMRFSLKLLTLIVALVEATLIFFLINKAW